MMHPIRGWRFARVSVAAVVLRLGRCLALCSVGMACGALNASVDVSPDSGHGGLSGDASVMLRREPIGFDGAALPVSPGSFSFLESPSDIAFNPESAGSVNRRVSPAPDSATVRDELAVGNAATAAASAATTTAAASAATTTTAATAAATAIQPIPEPTEYMLLAGGLLILWGVLRWKNRARPLVDMPRNRLKKR